MESPQTPHQQATKPSRKWYLLALFIFLLGPILGAYLIFNLLTAPKIIKFRTPYITTVNIVEPGEYTLWVQTLKSSSLLETNIPNLLKEKNLIFKGTNTGETMTLHPTKGWHINQGNVTHFSLGNIYFDKAGQYQISLTGPTKENIPLYLHKPSLGKTLLILILSLALIALGLVLGVLFALIIFVKRVNANAMEDKKPQITAPAKEVEGTNWAMLCHLSGFAGFFIPFANIIAPLVIWGIKKQEFPFVDDQGKEAINFQISILIYYFVSLVLILLVIGLFLLPLLAAFHIVAMIIASVEAAHGKKFRYPFCIRFLK